MIKIQNLKKVYGKRSEGCLALNGISMHVKKGEFVAIIGSSGSGKTTLLNIIGGLDVEYEGSCVVRNKEISTLSDTCRCALRSKYISYVYQSLNLISFLTVKENLCLTSQINKVRVDEKELNQVLSLLGLEQKKNSFVHELSGGQQQRVAIGRAILAHTDILLADEPTGNLDKKNAENVMNILKKMNVGGVTIILVTHDLKITDYANRVLHLENGKIV